MKTLKNLTLAAVMAFVATSVFAQNMDKKDMDKKDNWRQSNMQGMQNGMMSDGMMNMEDQDYSAWKDTFRMRVYTPVGAQGRAMMMMPEFRDSYDQKVYMYLLKETAAENMTPMRRFDGPVPIASFDRYWMLLERKANIYRRELMREHEMQMKMMPMMSGMSGGMRMDKPMDR